MKKSELIETIIALDPSQSAEDLGEMTVKLTSQIESINDRPEDTVVDEVEATEDDAMTEDTVVDEVEATQKLFVAEGKSLSVKGSILGPGALVDLPEESISRLMKKGIVKSVEG